jgi:hypothetical protein
VTTPIPTLTAPPAPHPPKIPKVVPRASEPDEDEEKQAVDGQKIAQDVTAHLKKKMPNWGRKGLLAGVTALEHANKNDRAEEILRKQRDPISHLELFLLQRKLNRAAEARTELLAWMKSHPDGDWPAPLLQAYAGTLQDQPVIDAAHGDPDDLCEAYYYLGRLHLQTDAALARTQLQRAADESCDESEYARQALQEIAGK